MEICAEKNGWLFDFYGTLVRHDDEVPTVASILRSLGFDCSEELAEGFEPGGFDGWVTNRPDDLVAHREFMTAWMCRLLEICGVSEAERPYVLGEIRRHQASLKLRPNPLAAEVLAHARNTGSRVAVCSNWEKPLDLVADELGLSAGVDLVVTSAELGRRKPHVDFFHHSCARLGVDPSDAVYVGDNFDADVIGALRAGLCPMWLRNGKEQRRLPSGVRQYRDWLAFARDVLPSCSSVTFRNSTSMLSWAEE